MTPNEIQSALDYDLFVCRDKRTIRLLSTIVTWAKEQASPFVDDDVMNAIEELEELSRA